MARQLRAGSRQTHHAVQRLLQRDNVRSALPLVSVEARLAPTSDHKEVFIINGVNE
jgi:hypothetical protein